MNEIVYVNTDEAQEFLTEERCHIIELLNHSQDSSSSIARARVEPSVSTAWHKLTDTSEIYYILEGEGLMELGEDYSQKVSKNDVIKIPSNTAQRITNTGNKDLIFLCFCVPAFNLDNYKSLE